MFEVIPVTSVLGSAYILKGDVVTLVDTMVPFSFTRLDRALKRAGVSAEEIEYILITHHHADHVGNLAKLKDISGAVVIAGEADIPVIDGSAPMPPPSSLNRLGRFMRKLPPRLIESYQRFAHTGVDRAVSGGEVIEELGLEVLALPGHTPGGLGFFDSLRKRAFVGDIVSNYFSRLGMPSICASDDIEEIFESQQALVDLGLETAYPGHGPPIGPNASEKISDMLARRREKGGA